MSTVNSSSESRVTCGPEILQSLRPLLQNRRETWLVTGAAGFIGSHIAEVLVSLGQNVVGLDNFATGLRDNLTATMQAARNGATFSFIEGDIRNAEDCRRALTGVQHVLHQAALGSVPRSIADPIASHDVNVGGFLNVLVAARDAGVKRFVYASSSSVYGDHPALPKRESATGRVLSPYAATKASNELYASAFCSAYGIEAVGLRYFNVFGPRQDPLGPYAAVIPKWMDALISENPATVNGDGQTSRDFCHVSNAVLANVCAAIAPSPMSDAPVFNIACGMQTTLSQLYEILSREVAAFTGTPAAGLQLAPFRSGDIRHSLADISSATERIHYSPIVQAPEGLARTAKWYLRARGAQHTSATDSP